MKHIKLIAFLSIFIFQVTCAQKDFPDCLYKINGFSEERFLGNIPVDEKGNPTRPGSYTVYTLYVETQGNTIPTWKTLTSGKEELSIETSEITDQSVTVGKQKNTMKMILLKKMDKHRLWKIESGPCSMDAESANKSTSLTLTGMYKNKKFSRMIKPVIMLESTPSQ